MIGEMTPLQKERRSKILQAAAQYFSSVQFHKADMEQIAQEAGVGKGTLYRYFRNKEDLYAQTIQYELDLAFDYIHQDASKAGSMVGYLENIISAAVTFFYENPVAFNLVMMSNSIRKETIAKMVLETQGKHIENFSQKFREGIQQGFFKPLNPQIAIKVLIACILHLVFDLHYQEGSSKEETIQHLKEIYLYGVLQKQ